MEGAMATSVAASMSRLDGDPALAVNRTACEAAERRRRGWQAVEAAL